MSNNRFSVTKRLKSFAYALNGFRVLFKEEHNSRIHLVATIFAVFLGFVLNISYVEWLAIILVIALVFLTELINSSLERVCNLIMKEKKKSIKHIKDLAAGAVLIVSIAALAIGGIIFIPKLWTLLISLI